MTEPAAIAETHISVIAFIGDRAYKLKKPVAMGFLDFSTRALRERACHREVELNRRLAPDVYLGVADVVGPDGELSDHLVVMARMPVERRLSTLVEEGDPDAARHVELVADQVADLHRRAARSPEIDRGASPEAVRANWVGNFEDLAPFVDEMLDSDTCAAVEDLVARYLEGRRPLLDARIAEGHVCDGHGDLQAADIFCLDDGPRILDCIEFADRFRYGDVMADVAFLAMDLERLGAPELAEVVVRRYRERSGDRCPSSLVDHYLAYRAHVRCKVNVLRAAQTDGAERADAVAEARRLLHMTHRYLDRSRVRLVVVGGTPGTGKSTLAAGIGDHLGWTVLRSDVVRDELDGGGGGSEAGFGEGRYSADRRAAVYDELLVRARESLRQGSSVVLDASWNVEAQREAARALAEEAGAELIELRCEVAPDIAETRIAERLARGADASEATPEVARRLASEADPWPEATVVSTDGSAQESLERALETLAVPPGIRL